MLLKISRLMGISIAGMALANVAWAEDVNVTTGATSAKLGGEFRSELKYHDHGLDKAEGYTPDATTVFEVQAAKIKLNGKINPDTEYAFRFNLLRPSKGPLDYGYGTHWFSKSMGFSIGKMKLVQGGWDNWDGTYRSHTDAAYSSNLVFDKYAEMAAVNLKVAGDVRLQLFNDVTTADIGSWNKSAHPTFALGWMGEFGPIKPLFNLGSYDNNKSRWIDVGIKTSMNGLNASLDIYNRNHVNKTTDKDGKAKELADVGTGITVNVAYEMKGAATPFLHFSTWDNKQGEDKDTGAEDAKVNTDCAGVGSDGAAECATWAAKYGTSSKLFDDNGQVWGVGADLNMMGKGWNPYIAIIGRSGKFLKDAKDPKSEEESKSEMWLRLGVLGEI